MKTFSQVVKEFDNGKRRPDEKISINTRDLARIYKAHQRALSEKVVLECKVASLELKLIDIPEHVVYG
jgi:hypothetical protein